MNVSVAVEQTAGLQLPTLGSNAREAVLKGLYGDAEPVDPLQAEMAGDVVDAVLEYAAPVIGAAYLHWCSELFSPVAGPDVADLSEMFWARVAGVEDRRGFESRLAGRVHPDYENVEPF